MKTEDKQVYICNNCGFNSIKWYGKCPECNEWNTFKEQTLRKETKTSKLSGKKNYVEHNSVATPLSNIEYPNHIRLKTGLNEFDRVLGGGIVKGSAVLLSGEPGIGKSILHLQICEKLSSYGKILYVSAEEYI